VKGKGEGAGMESRTERKELRKIGIYRYVYRQIDK
jgi:hypothetical protein